MNTSHTSYRGPERTLDQTLLCTGLPDSYNYKWKTLTKFQFSKIRETTSVFSTFLEYLFGVFDHQKWKQFHDDDLHPKGLTPPTKTQGPLVSLCLSWSSVRVTFSSFLFPYPCRRKRNNLKDSELSTIKEVVVDKMEIK